MGSGEGQNQSCPREEIKKMQARHTEDSGSLVESTKRYMDTRRINKRQVRLMRPGIANHSGGKESKDRKCDLRQMREGLQNTTGNR